MISYQFIPSRKLAIDPSGVEIKLTAQQIKMIQLLVNAEGKVVSKNQFFDEIWDGKYVEDKTYSAAFTKLRKKFGWDSDQYLVNERGKGYRLTARFIQEQDDDEVSLNASSSNNYSATPNYGDGEQLSSLSIDVSAQVSESAESYTTEQVSKYTQTSLTSNTVEQATELNTTNLHKTLTNLLGRVSKKVNPYLTAAIMLFVAMVAVAYIPVNETTPNFYPKIKPLTYTAGKEFRPALSPDKQLLAFTYTVDVPLDYGVKVKDLTNQNIVFESQADFASTATWNHDGNHLYYSVYANKQCQVVRVKKAPDLTFAAPEVITSCGSEKSEAPVAVDVYDEWLYFSYKESRAASYVIKRHNLVTNNEQLLSTPTEDAYGDYSLSLSPDSSKLAILNFDSTAIGRVSILDLDNKNKVEVFRFNHLLYNVVWSPDSQSLYYLNHENALSKFDIDAKQTSDLIVMPEPARTIQMLDDFSFLVGYGNVYHGDLYKLPFEQNASPSLLVESAFNDYRIAPFNEQGASFVYVSNRTNATEIWASNPLESHQVTRFESQLDITDLRVAYNDTDILFLRSGELFTLDLTNPDIERQLLSGFKLRNPIWTCDSNAILASAKLNDIWTLVRINTESGVFSRLQADVTGVRIDCDSNTGWVSIEGKKGLSAINLDTYALTDKTTLDHLVFAHNQEWDVSATNIYFTNGNAVFKQSIERLLAPIETVLEGAIQEIEVPDNALYFTQKNMSDSYIAEIKIFSEFGSNKQ